MMVLSKRCRLWKQEYIGLILLGFLWRPEIMGSELWFLFHIWLSLWVISFPLIPTMCTVLSDQLSLVTLVFVWGLLWFTSPLSWREICDHVIHFVVTIVFNTRCTWHSNENLFEVLWWWYCFSVQAVSMGFILNYQVQQGERSWVYMKWNHIIFITTSIVLCSIGFWSVIL